MPKAPAAHPHKTRSKLKAARPPAKHSSGQSEPAPQASDDWNSCAKRPRPTTTKKPDSESDQTATVLGLNSKPKVNL